MIIKRGISNESSFMLWHERLGHISMQRLERLVKYGVLKSLDLPIDVWFIFIKGKQTKSPKKANTRGKGLLELIHTNICISFSTICISGEKYLLPLFMIFHIMALFTY